jgi:hypothetical protein
VVDPTGVLMDMVAGDAVVAGIVSDRVRGEIKGAPPMVHVFQNAATMRPFGAGSGRIGMQLATYILRCYGADSNVGAIQARQLAGAVVDVLDYHRATTIGTKFIARVYAPDMGGLERDPVTKWPYFDVRADVYAAKEAVA